MLSNVYIAAKGNANAGIFKTLSSGALVHDLSIDGIFAGNYIGALAGTNNGGIKNVHVLASVQGDKMAGGICVENNGKIICSTANNTIAISGSGTSVGGICVKNTKTIENCENKSQINADVYNSGDPVSNIGGIAGENTGEIIACYNYKDIFGDDYIGGIAGKNSGRIIESINAGAITQKLLNGQTASILMATEAMFRQ